MSKELEDALGQAAAALLIGGAVALVEAGVSPAKAVSYSTMTVLEETFGPGVWELLKFPTTTRNRWRRQIKAAVELIPSEPSAELHDRLIDLLAEQAKVKNRQGK